MVVQGQRKRRALTKRRSRRQNRSRATLRRPVSKYGRSCVQRGGARVRHVYLDTYRNFMLAAVYLGWQCDQDVFPARLRTSETTKVVCSTLERMDTLAGLTQPSEYSVNFRISKAGSDCEVVVTWRAYIFDMGEKAYKGRIVYESIDNQDCQLEALTFTEFKLLTACAYLYCSTEADSIKSAVKKVQEAGFQITGSNVDYSSAFVDTGNCYAINRTRLSDAPWLRTWASLLMSEKDPNALAQLIGDMGLQGSNKDGFQSLKDRAERMDSKLGRRQRCVGATCAVGKAALSFVPGASAVSELLGPASELVSLTSSGYNYIVGKLTETLPVWDEVKAQVEEEANAAIDEKSSEATDRAATKVRRRLVDLFVYDYKKKRGGDNVKIIFEGYPALDEAGATGPLEAVGRDVSRMLSGKSLTLFEESSCLSQTAGAPPSAVQPLSSIVASLDVASGDSLLDAVTAVQAGLNGVEQSKISDLQRRRRKLSDEIANAKAQLAEVYAAGRKAEILSDLSALIAQVRTQTDLFTRPTVAMESMTRAYGGRAIDRKAQSQILALFRQACFDAQGGQAIKMMSELGVRLEAIEKILSTSGQQQQQQQQSSTTSDALLNRLRRFYDRHEPGVTDEVIQSVAKQYSGRQKELEKLLMSKYGRPYLSDV